MKKFALVFTLLLFTVPSVGAATQPTTGNSSALNYLSPDAIAIQTAIPAPPDAADTQAELNSMIDLQNTRTQADCDRANTEVDATLDDFFGPAYGPLSADEVNELENFYDKVQSDVQYFVSKEKKFWNRPRPYNEDSAIHPCIPLESSASYPSGHSTYAWTFAEVLGMVSPARKASFEARADVIAHDRVLGGVHHESDIDAGKTLAEELVQALVQSPAFENDLKNAVQDLGKP